MAKWRGFLNVLGAIGFSLLSVAAQDTEVTAEKINQALQADLFPASGSLWEENAADVAQRLHWPQESKTSTLGSYRLYAKADVRWLGARPYSCALYAEEEKPTQLSIVFANKGDFGKLARLSDNDLSENTRDFQKKEREQKRALKGEMKNFDAALKNDAETIEKALTDVLGPSAESASFGQGRDLKERVKRWNWNGTAILLATPRDEYVVVRIMPVATADAGGRVAKISDSDLRAQLAARVVKRENGDIVVSEIPMVDQGPKGFCVPATWERYLRYVGIPADMYVLAMAGGTQVGGGTLLGVMMQNADDLCRQYGRRVEGINPAIDARNLPKYIDDGLPIMWGCYVVEPLEVSVTKRTIERRTVTDWVEWRKSLDPFRAATKSIQTDPRNGHLRMIIGYNPVTREVAISDSWGVGGTERWLTFEEANAISQGMLSIIKW